MSKLKIIVELESNSELKTKVIKAKAPLPSLDSLPNIKDFEIDDAFGIVPIYSLPDGYTAQTYPLSDAQDGFKLDRDSLRMSFIIRGEIDHDGIEQLSKVSGVRSVCVDFPMEKHTVCETDAPIGSDAEVAKKLGLENFRSIGADGTGVFMAIVDGGINTEYLHSRGRKPGFDSFRSWVYNPGSDDSNVPGKMPVGHGTRVAYNACLAAPNCTLLDIALLATPNCLLSDGVVAYQHLFNVMDEINQSVEQRSLVVNNSWGVSRLALIGEPGQELFCDYIDNENHVFTNSVAMLAAAGADIVFSAGNDGELCLPHIEPDSDGQIYGVNSHASVITVGAASIKDAVTNFSSRGPGRLTDEKPDLLGYSHFLGSQIPEENGDVSTDTGTSASAPIIAGLIAAVRSVLTYDQDMPSRQPSAIKQLLCSTAEQPDGTSGFTYDYGHGIVSGPNIYDELTPVAPDICSINPGICEPIRPIPIAVCDNHPQLCQRELTTKFSSNISQDYGLLNLNADPEYVNRLSVGEIAELFYHAGHYDGQNSNKQTPQ